jgi:hypothetical protein
MTRSKYARFLYRADGVEVWSRAFSRVIEDSRASSAYCIASKSCSSATCNADTKRLVLSLSVLLFLFRD